MRVDARLLRAGVFLVALGVVPLLVQSGTIDPHIFEGSFRLWPLVLVVVGVGLLLRLTPLAVLAGVLVAGILGLVAGALIATGGAFVGGCVGTRTDTTELGSQQGTFSAEGASVRLVLDCGDLRLTTQAGDDWKLRLDPNRKDPPIVRADEAGLDVRSSDRGSSILDLGASQLRDRWEVALPTGPLLIDVNMILNAATATADFGGARLDTLEADINAGNATIDLSGATVGRIDAEVNAGKLGLRLGPGADLPVSVSVNAGDFELCVAPGTGLQIDLRETLSSNNFASRGLIRSGNQWRSPDFDSAPNRVRVQISPNVATVLLDPEGGCHE